jgi:hypothetical protein
MLETRLNFKLSDAPFHSRFESSTTAFIDRNWQYLSTCSWPKNNPGKWPSMCVRVRSLLLLTLPMQLGSEWASGLSCPFMSPFVPGLFAPVFCHLLYYLCISACACCCHGCPDWPIRVKANQINLTVQPRHALQRCSLIVCLRFLPSFHRSYHSAARLPYLSPLNYLISIVEIKPHLRSDQHGSILLTLCPYYL